MSLRLIVSVCVPGGLRWWFVAPSLCGSKASGRTAGPLCPEEAEWTRSASAGRSSSLGPGAGGRRRGEEEQERK